MKLSVITVSYNAAGVIEDTILSVISQNYDSYEYIVVDGASSDGTIEIVRNYNSKIKHVLSEPDSGIYEAMNKGVKFACGDYCIFMNAGDRFVNDSVLSAVSQFLDGSYDYVLGNEVGIDDKGKINHYKHSRKAITPYKLMWSSVSHQASFIKRSLLLDDPYDETLKLVSDWKFALKNLIIHPHPYLEINVDICFFLVGGLTKTCFEKGKLERRTVLEELLDSEQYNQVVSSEYKVSFVSKIKNKLFFYLKVMKYLK